PDTRKNVKILAPIIMAKTMLDSSKESCTPRNTAVPKLRTDRQCRKATKHSATNAAIAPDSVAVNTPLYMPPITMANSTPICTTDQIPRGHEKSAFSVGSCASTDFELS